MGQPQVEPEHYSWSEYETKGRWNSYWHQIDEVLSFGPTSCLEIGLGSGLVGSVLRSRGVDVTTMDFDERLGADLVGDVRDIPAESKSFDVVLCSQVLEHLPWSDVPKALSELRRVGRSGAVVSLPHGGRGFRLAVETPVSKRLDAAGRIPALRPHRFDGQHYWIVGVRGHSPRAVRDLIGRHFSILKEYSVPEYTLHRFYVLQPRG